MLKWVWAMYAAVGVFVKWEITSAFNWLEVVLANRLARLTQEDHLVLREAQVECAREQC